MSPESDISCFLVCPSSYQKISNTGSTTPSMQIETFKTRQHTSNIKFEVEEGKVILVTKTISLR